MNELASKLGRLATGIETDKVESTGTVTAGDGVTMPQVVLYLPDNGMRQAGGGAARACRRPEAGQKRGLPAGQKARSTP